MKVLLISASTLTTPYPVYPLGLDYVAGAIKEAHHVKIADMNELENFDSLKKTIDRFSPDIIGISLRNIDNSDTTDTKSFIRRYKELAEAVRNHSNALLVLGGTGFTLFPSEIMDALKPDFGIIGEGERLSLLLNALENKDDVSGIPGVITSDTSKQIPSAWDNTFTRYFNNDNSHVRFYLKKGGMLNLQTKRGCNFKCIYCTYPHIEGRKLRLISPAEVADTALKLQEAGAKYFFITDSVFNADYPHSIEIARAFATAGVSVPWGAFFAPTEPPGDYFRIMADSGLTHAEFGTESLSDKLLASYRKPFQANHVFKAHNSARNAGLHIAHYLLMGGPGEDHDSLKQTLSNLDKLDKTVLFFFCGMRIYPHTELYDIAVKHGQISESQSILEPVFYQPEAISSQEIIQCVKEHARGRMNWVMGSGGDRTAEIISRMYDRGFSGPLWEHLIR